MKCVINVDGNIEIKPETDFEQTYIKTVYDQPWGVDTVRVNTINGLFLCLKPKNPIPAVSNITEAKVNVE